jgi:ribonuclease PH
MPLRDHVAAVSCGVVQAASVLDLDYIEDSSANADANFVITGAGALVEVQATAEGSTFSEAQFAEMLALARKGIGELVDLQKQVIA